MVLPCTCRVCGVRFGRKGNFVLFLRTFGPQKAICPPVRQIIAALGREIQIIWNCSINIIMKPTSSAATTTKDKYRALLSSASKTAGSDNVSFIAITNATATCGQTSLHLSDAHHMIFISSPFFSGKLPPDVWMVQTTSLSVTLGGVSNYNSKATPHLLFAQSVLKNPPLRPTGISQSLVDMQCAG